MNFSQYIKPIVVCLVCIVFSFISYAQELHLYGGRSHDVYLGCINCSKFSRNSIWNSFSQYGSRFNSNSIWNRYGTYGSRSGTYSPWSNSATHPPVVVDKEGNFYGYLSVNRFRQKRATFDLARILYEYHEEIRDDVSKWYDRIFN